MFKTSTTSTRYLTNSLSQKSEVIKTAIVFTVLLINSSILFSQVTHNVPDILAAECPADCKSDEFKNSNLHKSGQATCPVPPGAIDESDAACYMDGFDTSLDPNAGVNVVGCPIDMLPPNGAISGTVSTFLSSNELTSRDTDWFMLDVSGLDMATVSICVEFDASIFMIVDPCTATAVGIDPALGTVIDNQGAPNDGLGSVNCGTATFDIGEADCTLYPAGTIAYFFVSFSTFNGLPCPGADYTITTTNQTCSCDAEGGSFGGNE